MSAFAEGTGGQVIPAEQSALQDVFSAQADALAQQLVVTFERPAGRRRRGQPHGERGRRRNDVHGLGLHLDRQRPRPAPTSSAPAGRSSAPPACCSAPWPWPSASPGSSPSPSRDPTSPLPTGVWTPTSARASPASGSPTPRPTSRGLLWPWPTRSSPPTSRPGSRRGWQVPARPSPPPSGCCSTPGSPSVPPWSASSSAVAGLAVLGLVLGVVGPWLYLKFRHSRRLSRFNGQLAETLGLMAGGLQAGPVAPTGRRHRRPRGQRAHGGRAQASAGGAAPGGRHHRRARERRPADGQRGLRLDRHGHPHPARGGWQPRRDPHDRRRHPARARVPEASGQGAERRGSPLRLHPRWHASGAVHLHVLRQQRVHRACSTPR